MNAPKRLCDWFDTVIEELGTCFEWLPPGTGHFTLHHGGVAFTYNSIPGDHFQLEWGDSYSVIYFLAGRLRSPERFVTLQTRVDQKIWSLSLDNLVRRDPLLRPNNVPNFPVLAQSWDAFGHWTEVRIDLSNTEYVTWKSDGYHAAAGLNAALFPEKMHQASSRVRDIMDHMNHESLFHGHAYASPEVITQLEHDLHNCAHIDPDHTAQVIVDASLVLPFCEAVRHHHRHAPARALVAHGAHA